MKKVTCSVCGFEAHFLAPHLLNEHNLTPVTYTKTYGPEARLVSEAGEELLAAESDNSLVDYDVKKTFGVDLGKIKTVPGFTKVSARVPKIDPDYVFDKELLRVVLKGFVDRNEKVLLTGPTGSGKSTMYMQVAARLNWPLIRINYDNDLTRSDLIGQWKLIDGKTVFQYGLIPTGMREGCIILQDEWDAMNPGVALAMQPVMEGGALTITETGEVIEPHPYCRLFATANTIGQGDATGLYAGTQVQNFATLDRFTMVEVVDYPTKHAETKIVTAKVGIDDATLLSNLTEVAKLVRDAFKKGDMVATMSTRTVVNVAKKLVDFGDVKTAYRVGFLNKLNEDDRAVVAELVQRVWGGV